MELLYIYIPQYGILNNIELNFTANNRFRYNRRNRTVDQVKSSVRLNDDFFTLDDDTTNVVENISAIVGNNGAGKTSIAKFIHDIDLTGGIEHILIWHVDKTKHYSSFVIPESLNRDEFSKLREKYTDDESKIISCYKYKDKQYSLNRESKHFEALKGILRSDPLCQITCDGSAVERPRNFNFVYSSNFYTPMHGLREVNKTKDISMSIRI